MYFQHKIAWTKNQLSYKFLSTSDIIYQGFCKLNDVIDSLIMAAISVAINITGY